MMKIHIANDSHTQTHDKIHIYINSRDILFCKVGRLNVLKHGIINEM